MTGYLEKALVHFLLLPYAFPLHISLLTKQTTANFPWQCLLLLVNCFFFSTENITNHSRHKDEFPRENFTLNCPLPRNVKGFYMKLYKGQSNQEVCSLYVDNGKNNSERTNESCEPIHSDDKVSFTLRNLKSKHSDTYICCLEVLTPVYRCCKSNEKHLYIQGKLSLFLRTQLNKSNKV